MKNQMIKSKVHLIKDLGGSKEKMEERQHLKRLRTANFLKLMKNVSPLIQEA